MEGNYVAKESCGSNGPLFYFYTQNENRLCDCVRFFFLKMHQVMLWPRSSSHQSAQRQCDGGGSSPDELEDSKQSVWNQQETQVGCLGCVSINN